MTHNEYINKESIATSTIMILDDRNQVTILPVALGPGSDNHTYTSTALSLKKYSKDKLAIDFLTEPKDLYEQRSATIYLPTIVFIAQTLIENKDLISLAIDTIYSFARSISNSEDTPVELSCVVKERKDERSIKLNYKGPIAGLHSVAPALLEVVRRED